MTSDPNPVRILHLEDIESDGELILASLAAYGLRVEPVYARSEPEFRAALERGHFDAILSDFTLPDFDGLSALQMSARLRPDVPFIFVSGTIGEERAVASMKAGASDYVLKGHLERLGPTLQRAIREAEQRQAKQATEEALAEVRDRMRFALEAASVGIWDWEVGSAKVMWSEVQESLHGVDAGTFEGTLDAAMTSIHEEDRKRVWRVLTGATPSRPSFRVDYRVSWPDASVHWIASVGRIAFDPDGQPIRAIGVAYDITIEKSLEEEVRQTQRLESIGGLAAGVAHDFNNLLTIINGYCGMLTERLANDTRAVADLEEIERAAGSAAALTRQLLAFSRKQMLMPRTVDLNAVISETHRMMRRLVEENIRIELRCAETPLMVRVDQGQIEQVILNLIVNARDAMPDGGAIVIETAHAVLDDRSALHEAPGSYVRLKVSDTGTGIPPEVQARIFEPFFTTKEQGRGTGLGLATIYGIVKQSGGHIRVDSVMGAGTTFTLHFPVVADEEPTPDIASKPKTAPVENRRILVVEDQPGLRGLVERMLKNSGYSVLLASNTEEAQRLCMNDPRPIHIVLTDLIMPGASGTSLAKWIEEHRPESKLMFMSGYSEEAFAHHGMNAPGMTLLQKPFSREELLGKIQEVMSKP